MFGQLYHPRGVVDTYDGSGNLLTTGYDLLNRLPKFGRGQLNAARTDFLSAPSHTQQWGLDAVGNWKMLTTDGGSPQNRMHNVQKQITSIDSGLVTPTYDANGNTTKGETGNTYGYDAWNRLVNPVTANNVYRYDALGRRIRILLGEQPSVELYYSSAWQVLEERVSGAATQYVWSPVYVDAMIERDTTAGRVYAQQDANWNVTGVISSAGAVQEHFAYDPYGKASVYDQNWNPIFDTLNWVYLHQGGRYDGNSGLYNFRNRDYSPTLGRWLQEDPISYAAGDANLYLYLAGSPLVYVDSLGLQARPAPGRPPVQQRLQRDPTVQNPLDDRATNPIWPFTPLPPERPFLDWWLGEARSLGIPESEIQAIITRNYSTMPGDTTDPHAQDLRQLVKQYKTQGAPSKDQVGFIKGLKKAYKENGDNDPCKDQPARGPYSFLAAFDPTPIKKGTDAVFQPKQKDLVRSANWVLNGGQLRSDDPMDPYQDLTFPQQSTGGVSTAMSQAEVDHIVAKDNGGTNSLCNARLISKCLNERKGTKPLGG